MAQHVKILGILHIVFRGHGRFCGDYRAFDFRRDFGLRGHVGSLIRSLRLPILGVIGGFVFILLLVLSLPGLVIGVGLMRFRPWARIAGNCTVGSRLI